MYVDADTPVNCVFAVSIAGTLTLPLIQHALKKICDRHPLLRVSIEEDSAGIPAFTGDHQPGEIPVDIVERTGEDNWLHVYQEEWKRPFNLQQAPLARVVWIRGDGVSELVIVCPHCICDGVSFVALMRELLLLLDKPEEALAPYTSFDNIYDLIPEKVLKNRFNRIKGWVLSWLARWLLPVKKVPERTGDSYLLHWRLSREETQTLLAACKKANTSVHAALCTAFLSAWRTVRGSRAKNRSICPVDIRRYLPEVEEGHMFAFAPIVELKADTVADDDFWTQARALKKSLTDKLAKLNVPQLLMVSEYFHASVKKLVLLLRSTDGSHDFTFSNMGQLNIPDTYESFEVRAIYSPTVAFPWQNPNTIVVSAFKKQMDFAFISHESFLSKEEADSIGRQAMAVIREQTGKPEYSIVSGGEEVRERWTQRFVQKNLLWYFIPNVFINWGVSYYGFDDRNAVAMFKGEHSFARFFLPMALFVPFCISWDVSKKSISFFEYQNRELPVPAASHNQFLLKLAARNGGITFLVAVLAAVGVHLLLPVGYTFNGTLLSVIQGILAGVLAMTFTLYCIRYVERRVR